MNNAPLANPRRTRIDHWPRPRQPEPRAFSNQWSDRLERLQHGFSQRMGALLSPGR